MDTSLDCCQVRTPGGYFLGLLPSENTWWILPWTVAKLEHLVDTSLDCCQVRTPGGYCLGLLPSENTWWILHWTVAK